MNRLEVIEMANYKKYFYQNINLNFPENSNEVINEVEKNFKIISKDIQFVATSKNPIDKRLDFCAYFLALIKTLDKMGKSYDFIRKVCLEIVLEYVRPKNKWQLFLKKIPAKLINTFLAKYLLIIFNDKVSQNANSEGFKANILTKKEDTLGFGYGIDIIECGICKLFNKHHYEKYSSILCEVDEITSNLAGLQLIRTSTIALGAQKCDFRYKKN